MTLTFVQRSLQGHVNSCVTFDVEYVGNRFWCLPDSPKPDSPKLGLGLGFSVRVRFRVRVRVGVSANRVSAKRVSANRD